MPSAAKDKPGRLRYAVVDGPPDKLACVKVFDFDGTYKIPGRGDPNFRAFLTRLGLTRPYSRLVDVTDRPDIGEGTPFPFLPAAAGSED
jgi:hypothetical protein